MEEIFEVSTGVPGHILKRATQLGRDVRVVRQLHQLLPELLLLV